MIICRPRRCVSRVFIVKLVLCKNNKSVYRSCTFFYAAFWMCSKHKCLLKKILKFYMNRFKFGPSFNSSIISFLVLTYLENLFPLWFMLSKIRSSTISLLYEKIPRQPQISTVFFLKNFATRKFIFSMVRFVV